MEEIKMPNHVAIIMDGNGRWATNRGLKRFEGHIAGSKNLEDLVLYIFNKGIKYLSVYAFSTDNFKRSKDEVDNLMNLFVKMFNLKFNKIKKEGIKVIFSGRRQNLRDDVLTSMDKITNETKNNNKGILNICLNYGSQEEIVDAIKKIVNENINVDNLTKEDLYKYLYQDLPPIDLLIRTSGEYRLSNFMLYQSSYSEFYFTNTLFPDFDSKEFDNAILAYNKRDRRFGENSQNK